MVACDFSSKFVHVSAGWEGSAADGRVLQDAMAHGFYVPTCKFYSVDEQSAIFMFCLSTNASNRSIQERFQHSGETIS